MSKLEISVCIIARDEEKYIEECLKHLLPYGMEIVVADTGSVDRTKEIAAKYADKVVEFTWCNDFSAARNYCAMQASNNWILAIDCDEYLEKLDVNGLRRFLMQHTHYPGQLRLKNMAYRNDGSLDYVYEDVVRLYDRRYYCFHDAVHEHIVAQNGVTAAPLTCFLIPGEAVHYGYMISHEEMKRKQKRNLALLYVQLEKEEADRPYTYFQIAQSQQVIGNMQEAIKNYEKCLAYDIPADASYLTTAVIGLATAYAVVNAPWQSLAVMERYASKIKNARFVYTYGMTLYENHQEIKALMQFILATTMPDFSLLGQERKNCYGHMVQIYRDMGDSKMADFFLQKFETCV